VLFDPESMYIDLQYRYKTFRNTPHKKTQACLFYFFYFSADFCSLIPRRMPTLRLNNYLTFSEATLRGTLSRLSANSAVCQQNPVTGVKEDDPGELTFSILDACMWFAWLWPVF
jgi:hypothetical protein